MKKLIIIILPVLCLCSCIKKNALKYDPDLVGTWVSTADSTYYWLIITPDGKGVYRTRESASNDREVSGDVKYSVFELKMWVGVTKFKVKEWLTGGMNGTEAVSTKDYQTLNNITYPVDRRMVLKTDLVHGSNLITFYRVTQ
jgi:hypothetical protein